MSSNGTRRSCLMEKNNQKISWHCPFNPSFYFNYTTNRDYKVVHTEFDIMSHSAFILYSTLFPVDIISHSTFRQYFPLTFFTIRHYIQCGVFYLRSYVLSSFCPIRRFVLSTFYLPFFFSVVVFPIPSFVRRRLLPSAFFTSTFCRWTFFPTMQAGDDWPRVAWVGRILYRWGRLERRRTCDERGRGPHYSHQWRWGGGRQTSPSVL